VPTPTPTATPFNAASVHIKEQKIAVTPLYVAAGPSGAAYYGFGSSGTGSNLYRLQNGSTVQTAPANAPSGFDPGGGVYGISVTTSGTVYWLSSYFGPGFSLFVTVECGGAGGKASLCEPTVDEPTSMVVDASGVFWVGGISFDGGGQIATSTNAGVSFDSAGVMQLIDGPENAVWGALADFSKTPAAYSIARFGIAGQTITTVQNLPLPAGESMSSMTVGGDGNFWFTDTARNAIGKLTPAGAVKEYPLPSPNALGAATDGQWQIATACDGAVWFTEPGPNKVARIDSSGKLNEFSLPTAAAMPAAIAAVPTKPCTAPELWFGEEQSGALASISF
jgi:streptogramin lyase